jgi:hypothetical protein
MKRVTTAAAVVLIVGALGCDSAPSISETDLVSPLPRRTVVWLEREGVDEETSSRLQMAGVDQLVVHRGTVNLAGEVPVFRLSPSPPVSGAIPVAIAIRVEALRANLGEAMAAAVWRAIAAEVGEAIPAEIILDLPEVAEGLDDFVAHLAAEADVPVVPVLSPRQLRDPHAIRAVVAARGCVVATAGTGGETVRGVEEMASVPLAERLEPLAALGVRVRLAVALRPVTSPRLPGWGDDLDPLTETENATVKTTSELDRSFVFDRAMLWSGLRWQSADTVAVRWFDASRLHDALDEAIRLALPEVGGWDLIPLPPDGPLLGPSREALIRYLEGSGPQPELRVAVERDDTRLTVTVTNDSPFTSAVTGIGNWFELSVTTGSLVAESRGDFDRLKLGTRDDDGWQPRFLGAPNAVRYTENYIGPGEKLTTGAIRLSSRRAQTRVRWHVLLSSGKEISGDLRP